MEGGWPKHLQIRGDNQHVSGEDEDGGVGDQDQHRHVCDDEVGGSQHCHERGNQVVARVVGLHDKIQGWNELGDGGQLHEADGRLHGEGDDVVKGHQHPDPLPNREVRLQDSEGSCRGPSQDLVQQIDHDRDLEDVQHVHLGHHEDVVKL